MSAPIDLFIAFLTPGQKPLNCLKWEENFLSVGEAEKTFLKIWAPKRGSPFAKTRKFRPPKVDRPSGKHFQKIGLPRLDRPPGKHSSKFGLPRGDRPSGKHSSKCGPI